ncbi:MAG: tetratricopeptide repeat protein [Myxococcales bacterium]|nr:tetratricopeptide repeat protein [Myxococcales bacterium]
MSPLPAAPEAGFCDIRLVPEQDKAPSCDVPSLPCGPLLPAKLPAGAQVGADLDGDGRADAMLIKRRSGRPGASYSAIYRSTPQGFVLADYHEMSYAIDPVLPRVVVSLGTGAPIIEDGFDEPLTRGRSLSERRLRRWNGSRFATLLRYCKNRQVLAPGTPARVAGQSVIGIDVDRDGIKEVVVQGYGPPRVFRLGSTDGSISEDKDLTLRYRQSLPAHKKAADLRERAMTMMSKASQLPRAVTLLNRARQLAPQDTGIALALADAVLRMRHGAEAISLLEETKSIDDRSNETDCLMARAYEQTGEREKEKIALQSCISRNPATPLQSQAEGRLRILSG